MTVLSVPTITINEEGAFPTQRRKALTFPKKRTDTNFDKQGPVNKKERPTPTANPNLKMEGATIKRTMYSNFFFPKEKGYDGPPLCPPSFLTVERGLLFLESLSSALVFRTHLSLVVMVSLSPLLYSSSSLFTSSHPLRGSSACFLSC